MKKGGFILNDRGDFLRGDADGEAVALVECGLGGGAEDGGAAEIFDEASEAAEDGMEEAGRQCLYFIEDDD